MWLPLFNFVPAVWFIAVIIKRITIYACMYVCMYLCIYVC
jgi:hypothetical protein